MVIASMADNLRQASEDSTLEETYISEATEEL